MWRSSETYIAIAAGLGTAMVGLGWIPAEQWNGVLMPSIVYVVGRLVSKGVKAV